MYYFDAMYRSKNNERLNAVIRFVSAANITNFTMVETTLQTKYSNTIGAVIVLMRLNTAATSALRVSG